MATLIQSKQIEGIVTSSIVQGEFLVSGSLIVTGSNSILGSVTASAISSSFIGDGSGITNITYSQIENTPIFSPGNNITITSSSNEYVIHATLDGTGTDNQNLSITGDQLTILGGNTITIPTGSTSWEQLGNIPSGLISGSAQITINQSQISDLSHYTDSDVKTKLDAEGVVSGSYVESLPSGTISGSTQITITESQISDLDKYTDSDVKTKLDAEGVVSGSVIRTLPSGTISGSSQITITETQISDLDKYTDSDVKTKLDSEGVVSGSVIRTLPSGTISGSEQLPSGLVSQSAQITITESQISDLDKYTDSDVKTKLDSEGVVSGSYLESLPQGVISGSSQLPSGVISGSDQITITESQISDLSHTDISNLNTFTSSIQSEVDSLTSATSSYLTEVPTGTVSGSSQIIESLPSGTVSGSTQITITESQISDLAHTQIPAGTISGSEQLPSGLVSQSSQITISESQISDLDKYTDSDVQTYIDSIGIVSGSVVADLPSGVISGSEQLPSGTISGSTQIIDSLPTGTISGSNQITITESQISDLDKYTDSDVKTKLDVEGVLSGSLVSQLPSGVISGSEQLPSGVISGSTQITISESQISDLSHYTDSNVKTKLDTEGVLSGSLVSQLPSGVISGSEQLPSGTISGSSQITDGSGIVSSSQQVINHLPTGSISGSTYTDFSSSVSESIDTLTNFSASHVVESASLDLRLDAVEGNVGWLYDLSNTVWNNVYIKSGSSGVATAPNGFETNNLPFKFRLNDSASLHYGENHIIYLSTFDRDTRIVAQVSSSYETGSREVGLTVLEINGEEGPTRINDSYWVLTRHTAGFVPSSSYAEASASFDHRIDIIVSSGSGADWNVNLTNIPSGIVSGSEQQYTASLYNGFALTSSLNSISESIDITIDNVFSSASSDSFLFGGKDIVSSSQQVIEFLPSGLISGSTQITNIIGQQYPNLVTGSSQIDHGSITGVVGDEHIDHTTVLINAGDGLDGGGDISDSRTITLNITSSHFETGVTNVLTSEGVVKTSTLNTDLISTDFSQSVDSRINGIAAGAAPAGTVSGSTQIDITQTQNYTAFSSSIATSISNVDSDANAISLLNQFTSSADTKITNLESFSSSLDATFATDTEVTNLSSSLSQSIYEAAQSGSGIDTSTFATTGSNTFRGSQFITGSIIPEATADGNGIHDLGSESNPFGELYVTTGSVSFVKDGSVVSKVSGEQNAIRVGDILITTSSILQPEGLISGSLVGSGSVSITSGSGVITISGTGGGVSNFSELTNIPSGLLSSSAQIASDISGSTNDLSSSLSQSIYEAAQSGSGVSSWNELSDIPSGIISGSEQLPSGLFSGSLVAGTNVTINQDGDDFYITASLSGGSVPSGTVSSSAQITYDGNRTISNDKLGDLFTDSINPGTSGSVIDFLNAVFYPNTGPTITTGNQTIIEYVTSGTTITTLSGTDPEGQSISFGTASVYTDDLVRVASNGVMTINALAESSSFNTDLVGGEHGHKVEVTATDTFGTTTEKDIYVIVTPNSTPVFRETSTSGNVITSVTANLNESSTDDTLVKRVYFSDANGDNITIYSSSIDNNHFDVTKYSTYVDIRQNTSSLDYEQKTSYTFSISASDEHYEAGQDSDSIVGLPITVNVTDNLTPTINNQTLSSINENSSNGATVDSISAADNEGNTITFVNFELHQLQLDDSVVSSGSYSGTSQLTDPHENPFQMSTSGVVTRKTGVYLNSDLINEYIYRTQVTDPYNGTSDVALITINITDDTPATLTDNWSAGPYIKESELSGTTIKTTDYGSTAADYGSNQSGTWSSSNSAISINTSGTLSLGVDISGSVTQSGDTIDSTITFTNTFGTTTTDSLTLDVVGNEAPTATFSNQSSIFNSNEATNGTNLVSVSISDTESDSPYELTIGGTHAGKLNAVPQNAASSSWELQASEDLIGGTYTYDVTITDSYSETTTYSSRTITIAQGDTGTLGGDTTSYIIESAENGDVFRDASGFGAGNASQLSVSYTNYGSPSVQSFTSSNSSVAIDSSGYITFNGDLSGTGSGETITSDITFDDQYGNVGSGSVTVNVFANNAPTATFSNSGLTGNYNENLATSGTALLTSTISDTEGDTPYSMSLSGTGAWAISAVPQNSDSSSYEIQVTYDTSSLVNGTYTYDVEVTDSFGKSTTYSNRTFEIEEADNGSLVSTDTYIIESAVSGDLIRRNSDGTSGTQSSVAVSYSPSYGSPVATNFASSNALIDIDSNGKLSVGNDISGSGNTNGSIIATTITWNDQYNNNGSEAISIDVTKNFAPTVSSTQTFNENTNQARGTSEIVRLNLTDTESDSIPNSGLSFSGYNTTYFTPSISTPQMKLLANSTNIPAGTYDYTASIEDVHGFDTTVHSGSVTISQADNGTLSGDTAIYIIESAVSGAVFRDATGYNNGSPAQVGVSYSPSYGSPSVQAFTTESQLLVVDDSGNMTIGVDLSGSVTQSGYTKTQSIGFTDEYGNSGVGTVFITVFGNQSPAAGFTSSSNYESDNATSGSDAGSLVVTDVESNSPFTISLGGTDGGKFDISGTSSPFEIQPTGSLDAGTYSIDITVTDTYSETVTLTNETIVVDASEVLTEGYVYYSNFGSEAGFAANYLAVMGASGVDSGTPPKVTGYTANTASPYYKFKTGDVGSSSITLAGSGTSATLAATISGSDFNTALRGAGNMSWGSGVQTIIVIPSGSTMTSIPTSMTDGVGGSTAGEYLLVEYADGTGAPLGGTDTVIHQLTLDSAVNSYTDWFVIGAKYQNSASGMRLQVIPSSGSISDF